MRNTRETTAKCTHHPINGSWNTWATPSGKEYFRCRFCNNVIEKTENRVVRKKSLYQTSVEYFTKWDLPRHYTDDDLKMFALIPSRMKENYKKWRDSCKCETCSLSRNAKTK